MIREINYDHLFQSQKQYRTLLDCMAKPGVIAVLDADITTPTAINKASVLIGFALLNSDVTFYNDYNQKEEINSYFLLNTSSAPAEVSNADFIFISGKQENTNAIDNAKSGLPEYPEQGAFVVIDVDTIADTLLDSGVVITLEGPGVKDTIEIYVAGISIAILEAVAEKNIEYPLGVDTIFADKQGAIFCIPRSNKFKYSKI